MQFGKQTIQNQPQTSKTRRDKRYRRTENLLKHAIMRAVSHRRIDVRNHELYTSAAISPPTFYSHYHTSGALLRTYEKELHLVFRECMPMCQQRNETAFLTLLEFIYRHRIYFGPTLKTYNCWLLAQFVHDMRPILASDKISDKCFDIYLGQVASIIFCWYKHEHFSRAKIPLYAKKLGQIRFINIGI